MLLKYNTFKSKYRIIILCLCKKHCILQMLPFPVDSVYAVKQSNRVVWLTHATNKHTSNPSTSWSRLLVRSIFEYEVLLTECPKYVGVQRNVYAPCWTAAAQITVPLYKDIYSACTHTHTHDRWTCMLHIPIVLQICMAGVYFMSIAFTFPEWLSPSVWHPRLISTNRINRPKVKQPDD